MGLSGRHLFTYFERGIFYVALAILELILYIRLVSNSEIFPPLPPKCWLKGVHPMHGLAERH